MKSNIASKVAVSLSIFGASCGTAVSLAVANANGKLADYAWTIKPLFTLGGASLCFAIYTLIASRDNEAECNVVRDVILHRGSATKADIMLDGRLRNRG